MALKLPQNPSRLKSLLFILDDIVGMRLFYKQVGTPVITLCIHMIRLAILGKHQGQNSPGQMLTIQRCKFTPQMIGNPMNIFHQCRDILKNQVIDPLLYITDKRASLVISNHKCVVDMTCAESNSGNKITVNLKMGPDFPQVIGFCFHNTYPRWMRAFSCE